MPPCIASATCARHPFTSPPVLLRKNFYTAVSNKTFPLAALQTHLLRRTSLGLMPRKSLEVILDDNRRSYSAIPSLSFSPLLRVIDTDVLTSRPTTAATFLLSKRTMKRSSTGSAKSGDSSAAKRAKVDASSSAQTNIGIHIFTRDFRIEDNRALVANLAKCDKVLPIFVFTPEQTKESDYFSSHSFAFLLAALHDLNTALKQKLAVFYGKHTDVLTRLVEALRKESKSVTYVSIAEDYTPYAKLREQGLKEQLEKLQVPFHAIEDHNITKGGLHDLRSGTGTKYRVFTPFYNAAKKLALEPILKGKFDVDKHLLTTAVPKISFSTCASYSLQQAEQELLMNNKNAPSVGANFDLSTLVAQYRGSGAASAHAAAKPSSGETKRKLGVHVPATRKAALHRLETYPFNQYLSNRDRVEQECSLLSPHFKFGLISAREAFVLVTCRADSDATSKEGFLRQMYWRDFYQYVTLHHPWILAGMRTCSLGKQQGKAFELDGKTLLSNQNFTKEYTVADIDWKRDNAALEKWKTGTTGVPLVDAGMREMLQTGFMHNRCRMVTAMFLTKNLLQDWRIGEKFFAQHLVDYDPMSNNGGWQWSSSTGADGSPYFRIMNAQSQLQKVDPQCGYTKRYVPEVAGVLTKDLHNWEEKKYNGKYLSGAAAAKGNLNLAAVNPLFVNKKALEKQGNSASSSSAAGTAAGVESGKFKYYAPMVDLKKTRLMAIEAFKKAGSKKAQGS
ncbi:unnamed protein product [Amoebophrya sp. A120]|nr:unnamed protein product [Amoebophrya sp. A120]|eukprot:GSA120T00018654001.1